MCNSRFCGGVDACDVFEEESLWDISLLGNAEDVFSDALICCMAILFIVLAILRECVRNLNDASSASTRQPKIRFYSARNDSAIVFWTILMYTQLSQYTKIWEIVYYMWTRVIAGRMRTFPSESAGLYIMPLRVSRNRSIFTYDYKEHNLLRKVTPLWLRYDLKVK